MSSTLYPSTLYPSTLYPSTPCPSTPDPSTPGPSTTSSFDLYGVRFDLVATGDAIETPIAELLGAFRYGGERAPDSVLDLRAVDTIEAVDLPREGRPHVTRTWARPLDGTDRRLERYCTVYNRSGGGTIVEFAGGAVVELPPDGKSARGWFARPDGIHPDLRASVIHYAITEILKRYGVYPIHASAVTRAGRGLVFPGPSGAGKTTACLALMRAGYRWLSDEHIFVRERDGAVELMGLPLRFNVSEHTIEAIPELARRTEWRGTSPKQRIDPTLVRDDAHAEACRADFIIFPHVVDAPESALVPIPKREALERLLPETLTVRDHAVASRQFALLSRLVLDARCLRLDFGSEILELPALIDALLDEASL